MFKFCLKNAIWQYTLHLKSDETDTDSGGPLIYNIYYLFVVLDPKSPVEKSSEKPLVVEWEKMSKSKYNGVDPQVIYF